QGASVRIEFGVFNGPPPGTRYVGEWWNDKRTFDEAGVIAADTDRSGVDAVLAAGVVISGHVTEGGTGTALSGIFVQAVQATVPCCPFLQIASTQTDVNGNYSLVVPSGDYKLQFIDFSAHPHVTQWWRDQLFDNT